MKYRRVGLALLMAFALGAGVLAPQALADSNARIVRLSYVDGEVQMDRRDGRGFEHAFLNMPLAPGTQVTTRDDGRAEIEFEDMSTVRLAPGTLVETQSLDLRSSGSKYTLVDLQDGTAYFNIRKRDDDNDFRVSTGQREFSLTRASRFRLRVDHKQVVLAVFSGEVEITDEKGRLTVRKNETLTLDLDDPSRYFLAKGVDQDRYDDWDRERDEYRDRYASQGSYRGYSSAYSYGVADLNYWGNYSYISGYGYMWRPHYYGIGWNPYSNGAWYWYPGAGWIWVSAYPWGWMPFRYGSWYYIGGHGWCWRPGRQWNSWSPVVAVHNPPAGHVVPTPPPPTGRRDPVLVGSGPTTILPPEDPGPGRGRRDPDALGRRGGNPTGGGTGVVGAPGAGSGGATSSGSGVTAGSGSGGSVGSGGSGRPAADSRGGRGSGPVREVELEDAIRNARERRSGGGQAGGGQHGGVITNSGPASPSGSPSSGGSGSGAAAEDSSPTSGRQRVPESRRMLPESVTRDAFTPVPSPGSSGSAGSGRSSGNGSGSGATAPSVERSPFASGGRSSEPRGEVPRGSYQPSSGPAASAPSNSAGSGSSPASSGSSGGGSGRSGSPSGSGSGGGGSSAGTSGSSSSGRSSGGGSASGAGRSSSGTGSSSSGARSSASTTPK